MMQRENWGGNQGKRRAGLRDDDINRVEFTGNNGGNWSSQNQKGGPNESTLKRDWSGDTCDQKLNPTRELTERIGISKMWEKSRRGYRRPLLTVLINQETEGTRG